MNATEVDIARRAGALCIASEPHREAGEDWPCHRCLQRVRNSPAPASSPAAGGSAAAGAGFDGAADALVPRPERPAAPPSDSSPPRVSDTQGGGTGHRYGPQGA